MKLNAKQLRKLATKGETFRAYRNEIYIVLDNVLDTYNIGSIFRLADAIACKKIYLCGETETPPNSRIKKASINTTEVVNWEYCETAVEAITKLTSEVNHLRWKAGGEALQVVAIEQSKKSIPYDKFEYKLPVCLVVGHETNGVSKEVLEICDGIVELPMFGINNSLNVMVSLGIVLYKVVEGLTKTSVFR